MCGFVGFVSDSGALTGSEKNNIIRKMGNLIAHRGPDGEGFYTDDTVALGFRRLSIIDLQNGAQPMTSSNGRYVITFNGEIYNYKELRSKLENEYSLKFKTESDTEVLLETIVNYGMKALSMFRGMFSFIIYDKKEKKIFGARDPFGIKPLYYTKMQGSFMFASEIKAFLAHPHFKKEVNKDALKLYLTFQYTPIAETMFKDVFKLEPGHFFIYDGEKLDVRSYFNPAYKIDKKINEDEAALKIFDAVKESVKYHKIADVEVGSFLSGGADSSFITAIARPENTFSVGFAPGFFDEGPEAAEFCENLQLKNLHKEVSAEDFFEAVPKVQYYSDEPHANLSAVPLYFLSGMAAENVKVVMSGEGADEFFGGYETYHGCTLGTVYRKIVPKPIRHIISKGIGDRDIKGLNFLKRNTDRLTESYIGQAFIMNDDDANSILKDKYKSSISFKDITRPYFEKAEMYDEVHKKMYLDMNLWLPNDILLKADKMSMANSLELRVPYLDKEVWAVSSVLPEKYLVNRDVTKKTFRKSTEKILPKEWVTRKKKGFPVPLAKWLKEQKYADRFREMFKKPFAKEFFDTDILNEWLDEHCAGKRMFHRQLYTVYAFLCWYEVYFVDTDITVAYN